jgi:hypothetical protein
MLLVPEHTTPSQDSFVYPYITSFIQFITQATIKMKLSSLFIIASSFLTVSAFGVKPAAQSAAVTKQSTLLTTPPSTAFTKASTSPLFRDFEKIRGGAVPGWAAYNDALDKKPLVTKALTSLVGWALGDLLAQVSNRCHFLLV